MFNTFDNMALGNTRLNGSCAVLDSAWAPIARSRRNTEHGPTFSKVFRWQPADPHDPTPYSVELAGSFTDWRAVALARDAVTNTWQATLHGIPGNRTHRYMLIVNGESASDKNCDGLAVPEGLEEQKYQLMTVRGPRIFLLFSQTK
jgi:hypothetical protein